MGKKVSVFLIISFFFINFNVTFAANNADPEWRTTFKQEINEFGFEPAVANAIKNDVPSCEVLKASLELGHNPYNIIKTIIEIINESAEDVKALVACAADAGITTDIISKAALDGGAEPEDTGLPYTPAQISDVGQTVVVDSHVGGGGPVSPSAP